MQEKILYEYAVIRVLPAVEREEFMNIGIILFSKKARYVKALFHIDKEKLQHCFRNIDIEQLEENIRSLEKITQGDKDGGPIAKLDIPERFRWLTAVRSSSLQVSRPHPGLCDNLDETLQRLFSELVL